MLSYKCKFIAGIKWMTAIISTYWWWPGIYNDVTDYILHCIPCIFCQKRNLKEDKYHSLDTVFEPRQLVYFNLLGAISGINLAARYVLTALNG